MEKSKSFEIVLSERMVKVALSDQSKLSVRSRFLHYEQRFLVKAVERSGTIQEALIRIASSVG
jgi:hypothetical protein